MEILLKETLLHYRLTNDEVSVFAHEGVCKQRMVIGEEPIVFLLQRTLEVDLRATLHTNLITVLVPEALADDWASGTTDKLETQDDTLQLLIEKI